MKYERFTQIKLLLILVALLLVSGVCSAAEFYLRADTTTLTMPDSEEVTMWGFALDSSFGALDGEVMVPGPLFEIPPGDTTLTIHLDNNLPVPVSIVIPGLVADMDPVYHTTGEYQGRVRSFVQETPAGNGSPVNYMWSDVGPGSRIYHSGTHPQVQVPMGLYGAVVKNAAPGQAYAGILYDSEVTLFYSEIDPALHAAVATGNYGPGQAMTSTVHYNPKYFLVNGEPYSETSEPLYAGAAFDDSILIRYFNAGIQTHSPMILANTTVENGVEAGDIDETDAISDPVYMSVVAEDGFKYTYPKKNYSILLDALKTKDVIISPTAEGLYPVFDRSLSLTNVASSPGGFLAFLEFDPALNTTITSGPAAGAPGDAAFTYEANKPVQTFYYRLYPMETEYTRTIDMTKSYYDLPDGNYQFIVFARGIDGTLEVTPARWSFTVDRADINTTITSVTGPNAIGNISFEYLANMPVQAYYYRLWPLESAYTRTASTSKAYVDLPAGNYQFIVFARAGDGTLETTPARHSFTVTRSDINTVITSGPASPDTDGNVSFNYAADLPVQAYYYRLYPMEVSYNKTTLTTASYSALANGDYQFIVFARQSDGTLETTPARWSFAVNVPGGLSVVVPSDTTDAALAFEGAVLSDGVMIELYPNVQAHNDTIALFRYVPFTLNEDSTVHMEVAAACASSNNDDDLVVVLRNENEASQIMSFNGDDMSGTIESRITELQLAKGDYTVEFYAEGSPTLHTIKLATNVLDDLMDVQLSEQAASEELALFKDLQFAGEGDVLLQVIGRAGVSSAGDDDLVIYVDGTSYGMNSEQSIDGDAQKGNIKVVTIPITGLAKDTHTISLVAEGAPTVYAVRVLTAPADEVAKIVTRTSIAALNAVEFTLDARAAIQIAVRAEGLTADTNIRIAIDGRELNVALGGTSQAGVVSAGAEAELGAGKHTLSVLLPAQPEVTSVRIIKQ